MLLFCCFCCCFCFFPAVFAALLLLLLLHLLLLLCCSCCSAAVFASWLLLLLFLLLGCCFCCCFWPEKGQTRCLRGPRPRTAGHNSTKTCRERRKNEICGGESEKQLEMFCHPFGPHPWTPSPFGPPHLDFFLSSGPLPSGNHPSGPYPSGFHFFRVWAFFCPFFFRHLVPVEVLSFPQQERTPNRISFGLPAVLHPNIDHTTRHLTLDFRREVLRSTWCDR